MLSVGAATNRLIIATIGVTHNAMARSDLALNVKLHLVYFAFRSSNFCRRDKPFGRAG
jgi:hypothetical protein